MVGSWGGAIENRLADEIGEVLFEDYAERLMNVVGNILRSDEIGKLQAATEMLRLMREKGGVSVDASAEQIASEISASCQIQQLGKGEDHPALFYGASVPAPSGRLAEGGIKLVVLTNVTPEHKSMTRSDMSDFTYNACKAADLVGVNSITIPAVGTGFATAFGFGLSREDSFGGFLDGAKRYVDEFGRNSSVKQIDYNIYARPSQENAKQVAKLASDSGIHKLLKG